jgi:hypothetical protein
MGSQTQEAVKRFQEERGLTGRAADGDPGPNTRAKLFLEYMDKLCRGENGNPFKLEPTDFLVQGADRAGKGDYQGCSEFNPVLMFSQEEKQRYEQAREHTERNAANAPNRRVGVFLLRPGSRVNAWRWPCPRAKEGVAGCKKRFWSDASQRRSFRAERREQERTKDTFACRFYDRIAGESPCERTVQLAMLKIRLVPSTRPLHKTTRKPTTPIPYKIIIGGRAIEGETDAEGILREKIPPDTDRVELNILGRTIELLIGHLDPVDQVTGLQARLNQLGYMPGPVDGIFGPKTKAALSAFQILNGLSVSGEAGADSKAKLSEVFET